MFSQRPNSGTPTASGCGSRARLASPHVRSASGRPPSVSSRDRRVDRGEERVVPRLELRIEQVHRPLGDELPDRPFGAQRARVVERRIRARAPAPSTTSARGARRAARNVRTSRYATESGEARPVHVVSTSRRNSRARRWRSAGDAAAGSRASSSSTLRQRSRKSARVVELDAEHVARRRLVGMSIRRSRIMRARMPSA